MDTKPARSNHTASLTAVCSEQHPSIMKNLIGGNYHRALSEAQEVLELFTPSGKVPEDSGARVACAHLMHITGRVYFAKGEKTTKEARDFFRLAATLYRSIGEYELENILWLLKVEMLPRRLALIPRGLWLAQSVRQYGRVLALGLSRWITLHVAT